MSIPISAVFKKCGHPKTPQNIYQNRSGTKVYPRCKRCMSEYQAAHPKPKKPRQKMGPKPKVVVRMACELQEVWR